MIDYSPRGSINGKKEDDHRYQQLLDEELNKMMQSFRAKGMDLSKNDLLQYLNAAELKTMENNDDGLKKNKSESDNTIDNKDSLTPIIMQESPRRFS